MADQANSMVMLVGSNPLPNHLAWQVLKSGKVCLVYTRQTAGPKDRLASILREQEVCVTEIFVDDAASALSVRRALNNQLAGTHLNYTGGTKVMAANALVEFKRQGGKPECSSYVDDQGEGQLRFDDGTNKLFSGSGISVTLDTLCKLHGLTRSGVHQRSDKEPTVDDADRILRAVVGHPELASELYDLTLDEHERRRDTKEVRRNGLDMSALKDLGLSQQCIGGQDSSLNGRDIEAWLKFLGGIWLEVWIAELLKKIAADQNEVWEISQGVNLQLPSGRQFEIDVLSARGHRLYALACTTDATTHICKSKLFEVALRARQVGGDLARSALVSLMPASRGNSHPVLAVQQDLESVWMAPDVPHVFGLDSLALWAGEGRPRNIEALRNWLSK